jgi:molybdopterin-containing oxidoreductase family membrane subunit
MYYPTWVDLSLLAGTIGFFGTLFLLFLKFVPAVALSEVKEFRHELAHGDPGHQRTAMEGAGP